jgi:hypothetical protein
MNKPPKPLYRKENKLAAWFDDPRGGSHFRYERNTKKLKNFEGVRRPMGQSRVGYDYTPLFKFLLSKVGQEWDIVFSEAVKRLDKKDPIFWMVDLHFTEGKSGIVRIGETTYYSKLTVKDGILVIADANATPPQKRYYWETHTFNGTVY